MDRPDIIAATMIRNVKRTFSRAVCAATLLVLAGGCVERLLLVRSDPPGALVHVNGREVGVTPLEHEFTFYGTFDVQVRHEGYHSRREAVVVHPPWYEVFPADLVSELLVPWTLRDIHEVEIQLVEARKTLTVEDEDALRMRADALRRESLPDVDSK